MEALTEMFDLFDKHLFPQVDPMNKNKRKRQKPPLMEGPYNTGVESSFKPGWWKKFLHAINFCPTNLGQNSKKVLVQERQAEGEGHPSPIDCDIFYNFMLAETKLPAELQPPPFQVGT